jgi:transposase
VDTEKGVYDAPERWPQMPKKRKQYNREFKIEAVKLTEDPERSVASVASSLGVSISTLHSWRKKYSADGSFAFPGHGNLKPADDEVRKLKKDLARVRQERDILKKAMGYFVNDKR